MATLVRLALSATRRDRRRQRDDVGHARLRRASLCNWPGRNMTGRPVTSSSMSPRARHPVPSPERQIPPMKGQIQADGRIHRSLPYPRLAAQPVSYMMRLESVTAHSQLPLPWEFYVWGSALPAVRIEINPEHDLHYGIGLEDVRARTASANANSPKGAIEDDDSDYQVYANDQASHADQYRDLVIAYRNGGGQARDVAQIVDSVEDLRNAGLVNGNPGIVVSCRASRARTSSSRRQRPAELPRLIASLPGDIDLTVAVDRSKTIRQSLHDTEKTLVIAVVLVILVVSRSCAAYGRRRSRASRCRPRSSARSASCFCLASASTICR